MRKISRTARFRKDYKREKKGEYRSTIDTDLTAVLGSLAMNASLPQRYRDHPLAGEWTAHRDLHLKPDLILIYRYPDRETIELVRLGSHSELGL